MAPLGALSQAWTSAEASPPLGWQLCGLYRFDDLWIARSEEPAFDDYLSGSGLYAEPGVEARVLEASRDWKLRVSSSTETAPTL